MCNQFKKDKKNYEAMLRHYINMTEGEKKCKLSHKERGKEKILKTVFYKTKYCYFVTYNLLNLPCRIHHMNFTFSEKIKVDKSSDVVHLILAYISLTV